MKNILKKTIFALLLISLGSCTEKDIDPVASPNGGPKLSMSAVPTGGLVLSPASAKNLIAALDWEHSENGIPSQANYTVEIAKSGTSFAAPIAAGTTQNKFLSWTHEQLNGALDPIIFIPYVASNIDVRVKSSLGNGANAMVQYSNVITVSVTPYSTALPKLGVPGNHMGWTLPTTAALMPQLASSGYGKTNYEGYMTLNGDFKFLTPLTNGDYNWGPANWGDDGSFGGVLLSNSGTNANIAAGYYLVKANTATTGAGALQYSADPITWSVTGSATPLGWPAGSGIAGQDHDMTYNATTKKWTVTLALTGGQELKFRANDAWTINLGKFDASKTGNDYGGEDMSYSGGNIPVATSGTYTITLDLSNPRAYKYSIN